MFEELKSHPRFLNAAVLGLAFAGASAMSLPAHAQQADSITVVKDAESGKLRAPTAAELATLQQKPAAKASLRVAKPLVLQKYHRSGAQGLRLTEEFSTSLVAVRNADGSVGHQCVEGHDAAHPAHAAATPATSSAPQSVTE